VTVVFRTPHDLLVYLVELSDSEQSWFLNRGQELVQQALRDGKIEHSESDYSQMARLLWALEADGSITFQDYAGMQVIGGRRNPNVGLTYNDLVQASDITVTSHGRMAAQTSRPTVAVNIANIDLTVLLNAMEAKVDEIAAPEEAKDEARSKLREARDVLVGVGTGATGEVLAAALRSVLGLS